MSPVEAKRQEFQMLRWEIEKSQQLEGFLSSDPHNARGWGEEQPAVLDVRSRTVANHVLNVVIETVRTCKDATRTNIATQGLKISKHRVSRD